MAQSASARRAAQRSLATRQRAIRAGKVKPEPYKPFRQALARIRPMRIITQDGRTVDPEYVARITTKAERSRNAKHANAVGRLLRFVKNPEYLNSPKGRREYDRLVRKIESFEGKTAGGRELANDPEALIEAYLADPDAFQFEDIYEEAA